MCLPNGEGCMRKKTRASKITRAVRAVKTLSELRVLLARMTPIELMKLDEEINAAANRVVGV